MMNNPDFIQNAMNMFSFNTQSTPSAPSAPSAPFAQSPSTPAAPQPSSNDLSPQDKQQFLQITGMADSPTVSAVLAKPKAARAVRSYLQACNNLVNEGLDLPNYTKKQISDEERFADQLKTLNGMGFDDNQKNIQYLRESNGNVQVAINRMIGN